MANNFPLLIIIEDDNISLFDLQNYQYEVQFLSRLPKFGFQIFNV
jgi:hypothetical protein